jgi:hypothetical protein
LLLPGCQVPAAPDSAVLLLLAADLPATNLQLPPNTLLLLLQVPDGTSLCFFFTVVMA